MKSFARWVVLPALGTFLFLSTGLSPASADSSRETIRKFQERLEAAESPEQREAVVAEMREAALHEGAAFERIETELRETDRELRDFALAFGATRSALHTWHAEVRPPEDRRARIEGLIEEMNAMVRQSNELAASFARRALETPHFSGEDEEKVRQFFHSLISKEASREMTGILHPNIPASSPPSSP